MTAGGNKNGIQIQYFHTQILQIIHFLQNPLQIAAIKMAKIAIFRLRIPVFHALHLIFQIVVFPRFHIIGGISVAKTIYKNLVHDCASCPSRCLEIPQQPKIAVHGKFLRYAVSCIIIRCFIIYDLEKVICRFFCRRQDNTVAIEHTTVFHSFHQQSFVIYT